MLFFEMKKLKLNFPLKAISLNHAVKSRVVTNGKKKFVQRYKSPEYKNFQTQINKHLATKRKEINQFLQGFDHKAQVFKITLIHFLPDLFVKSGDRKGLVSNKSIDLSNSSKVVEDCVFAILQAQNRFVDDRSVVELHTQKKLAQSHQISFEISTINKDEWIRGESAVTLPIIQGENTH
jgi:Holliday junction resolvase RusA-like endonuclease